MVHIDSIVLSSLYMLSAKLHKCTVALITELIDSICRDSTDTQYMTKQTLKISKMLNLYFITMYHSSSSVFIINNMPSGAKKASRKYQGRKSPEDQNVFLSCSHWLVQTVCTINFAQTTAFYTEQFTSPLLFHLKSHKVIPTGH